MTAGRGPLTVLVEVGDLVPGLRLVQFHRARGDSIDFFQFYGALLPLVRSACVTCVVSWPKHAVSPLSHQSDSIDFFQFCGAPCWWWCYHQISNFDFDVCCSSPCVAC